MPSAPKIDKSKPFGGSFYPHPMSESWIKPHPKPTANKLLSEGNVLDNWAVDYDYDTPNAGDESLVELDGKFFLVTTWNEEAPPQARATVKKVNVKEQLEEGGHIADLLRKFGVK